MSAPLTLVVEAAVVALLFAGVSQFRTPPGAWRGNLFSLAAFGLAVAAVLFAHGNSHPALTAAAIVAGGAIGIAVALRVNMLQIPGMVAFQHGAGGVAAFLVSFVELARGVAEGDEYGLLARASGLLGLVIGAATSSGSFIAAAKLSGRMRGTPVVLPGHGAVLASSALALAALLAWATTIGDTATMTVVASALVVVSLGIGVIVSIRIGGADMPVLVSFLNASAGLAAAFCGIALGNRLLVVCGSTVAASGSILTHVMCRAMNRSLLKIFTGLSVVAQRPPTAPAPGPDAAPAAVPAAAPRPARSVADEAVEALAEARRVVIVPGYGMALAQAQFAAVELSSLLAERGAQVKYAIHPVAGRMPGHMNVLLAEADASYDLLVEMDEINPELPDTDVAVVIGACDVVNPAAQEVPDTPIAGMPILDVHRAKRVVVCNLDDQPGYSGVPNSLYQRPSTLMLLGNAKETVSGLVAALRVHAQTPFDHKPSEAEPRDELADR